LECSEVYIIRNGQVSPSAEQVERKLTSIIGRTISAMIKSSGQMDLVRMYFLTERDGIDFNYVEIPPNFPFTAKEAFDQQEMIRVYELGYQMASSGNFWHKNLPYFE